MPTLTSRAWEALTPPLAEWILEAISHMGFSRMTPVQASVIPLFTGNKDVVVEAVTGSGKTLAFLIPMIQRILRLGEMTKKHHVSAIIISPTRELASQIHDVLVSLLAFHGPSAAALRPLEAENANVSVEENDTVTFPPLPSEIYSDSTPKIVPQLLVGGSVSPREDLRCFLKKSPNILVATPGRLLEILSSPHVHCTQLDLLIMDEADRLLDLGFKDDLQKILGRLPKQRRTGLFSASVSEALDQIIRVGLRNPVKIAVKVKSKSGDGDQRTPISLQMSYLTMPPSHKIPTLAKLLKILAPTPMRTIVYLSTCAGVDYYQYLLSHILTTSDTPITTIPLHGKHSPNVRQKNFARFVNAATPALLLTTDVAARGLDIPQVDLVVQLEAPSDAKTFLHRCGRAGRAGRKGLSVIFLHTGREEDYIPFLQVRKTPVTPLTEPLVKITDDEARDAISQMRSIVRGDRALHDKGQRAFVSWVQAYSKHQAASIFRVADLDWTELGSAWALMKLPKMPELRRWEGDRSLGVDIDWESYAYKDKAREKRRLEAASATKIEHEGHGNHAKKGFKKESQAWSQKTESREERTKRREARHAKRKRERFEKMDSTERAKQVELDQMIEEVKRRRLLEEDASFEGFND